ncbi:MAG: DUF4340 domain-containing protein [Thermogutta sp.]
MTETRKTFLFVGATLVVLAVAWWVRYVPPAGDQGDMRGKVLFPAFTNALDAASLEITEYDPNKVGIKTFKVAQVNNRWSIPSHDNYPADAKDHLAQAATSLIGLKVLDVPASSPTQDELAMFGVVTPDPDKTTLGTRGIGKRVVMRDAGDRVLIDVILGNKLKDNEQLRYVRVTGQDPVYVVKLSDDKLSGNFGDWIEKDLLKLNPWDIKDVQLHDYSFDSLTSGIEPRSQIVLKYDDLGNPRWSLSQDLAFEAQSMSWKPRSLGDDEELDTAKLDALRTALDDLKIVDVRKKPEGLSASLSSDGSFATNQEALADLQRAGFFATSAGQFYRIFPPVGSRKIDMSGVEIISSEGEIRVGMKDGVRYLLRFGRVLEGQGGGSESGGDQNVNRFLLVTAEFDPQLIPEPELQPLPEVPAEEGSPSEVQKGASENASNDSTEQSAQAAENSGAGQNGSQKGDQSGETTEKKADNKTDEVKAERERIEKENQRKRDEYQEKLKKGEERVKELNARFADWYYIISDEVYRKIRLSRQDIVKKKETKSPAAETQTENGQAPTEEKAKQPPATEPAATETQTPPVGAKQTEPQPGEMTPPEPPSGEAAPGDTESPPPAGGSSEAGAATSNSPAASEPSGNASSDK